LWIERNLGWIVGKVYGGSKRCRGELVSCDGFFSVISVLELLEDHHVREDER
jgi:hypothetical protein